MKENRSAMPAREIPRAGAALVFVSFTAYFYLLLFTLRPLLMAHFSLNPALYWFITGYFLFIPLFLFAVAGAFVEGNRSLGSILAALHVRLLAKKDWRYALGGLLLAFALSGLVFAAALLLNRRLGIPMLSTTPWFMEMRPFRGGEKLLLLAWLPMFFFNIAGEELLWRGYLQPRLRGPGAWTLCSVLWLIFHLPFGPGLMILLVPVIVIIPYCFQRTGNTLVGVFIHGMYNGPLFVAIALGAVGT